jgi:hypothetical protein
VSTSAFADIVDVSPSGFLMRHEVPVNASPDKAYAAFVSEIGEWWNGDHTYSRSAKNLSIDARPLGCFCEKLANGGGISHMMVVYVQPNNTIRMVGGLGPLQATGVSGSLTMRFIAPPAGTTGSKIEMSYSVGGYMQGGYEKIAPVVNSVMVEQLTRLKTYIDTGKPTAS